MEIVQAGAELVHVRVSALGHTCDGVELREVVEREVRAQMPDLAQLEVESGDPPVRAGNFVPLTSLRLRRPPRLEWHTVLRTDDVPSGCVRGSLIDSASVLVANLDGHFVAYRNACPGTPLPLHGGTIDGSTLLCPWHRCRFDLRDGRRLDERRPGGNLETIALTVADREVRIGLPQGEAT
jgi:nitrite reductase/ring-hydroxylating ferredoxin subunit